MMMGVYDVWLLLILDTMVVVLVLIEEEGEGEKGIILKKKCNELMVGGKNCSAAGSHRRGGRREFSY
jgi:hypothetical protein